MCVLCVLCVCSVCLASRPALTTNWSVPYRDRISIHVTLWKKANSTFPTTSRLNCVELLKLKLLFDVVPVITDADYLVCCWLFSFGLFLRGL